MTIDSPPITLIENHDKHRKRSRILTSHSTNVAGHSVSLFCGRNNNFNHSKTNQVIHFDLQMIQNAP